MDRKQKWQRTQKQNKKQQQQLIELKHIKPEHKRLVKTFRENDVIRTDPGAECGSADARRKRSLMDRINHLARVMRHPLRYSRC